jgi:late competence protein required for DNA uptake (superfamily II DNA/RNA helicase)
MSPEKARALLAAAVRRGIIRRPAYCQRCGATHHMEGHHMDYARPYDVLWLCRRCHMSMDGRLSRLQSYVNLYSRERRLKRSHTLAERKAGGTLPLFGG